MEFCLRRGQFVGVLGEPRTVEIEASYLGLRPESLSRSLKKLEKEGIIRNRSKSIELLDTETYSELICGGESY